MLEFYFSHQLVQLEFEKIKIINFNFPSKLTNFFQKESFKINQITVEPHQITIINETTKLNEFCNFNKDSQLLIKMIDLLQNSEVLNKTEIQSVIQKIIQ